MTTPNTAAITASIERSLKNCSLSTDTNNTCGGAPSTLPQSAQDNTTRFADDTLELNSQIRLPYYWEQCLDLKTGEVYYINWRTGMKSRSDPRLMNPEMNMNIGGGRLIYSQEEEEEEDNEQSAYDSEGSSTAEESSPSSSTMTSRSEQCRYNIIPAIPGRRCESESESENESSNDNYRRQQVLVVAGCKGCFMYFMVPKQVEDCPKCFGQLLHFDRSENGSP